MRRRYLGHVVRMFPDHAESVLWFPYPIDYATSGLPDDLVADLGAWEASYYAGLQDYEWRDRRAEREFWARGQQLGARVAEALGEGFAVEVERRLHEGRGAPGAPAAATTFAALAAQQRAEEERIDRLVAEGGPHGWFAYPPAPPT